MTFQPKPGLIRWRLHLASPPEKVYEALATAEGRARFWAESAPESEGVVTFHFLGHEPHEGRILRREPPVHLAVEYFGTLVEFTLEPDGRGGTDLALLASEVDEHERMELVAGWVSVLLAMKAAVDFGIDLRNHDPERTWARGYADN